MLFLFTATLCPEVNGSDLLIEPTILVGYRYGTVVTFKCKNGYKIEGPSALRCTVDSQRSIIGHWNATQPECVGKCLLSMYFARLNRKEMN